MNRQTLEILEAAISDVGIWTWWVSGEDFIQTEFYGVQLFNSPRSESSPPSGQLALRFIKPQLIVTLERGDVETAWYEQLNSDEIDGFTVNHDQFTMTDVQQLKSIVETAHRRHFRLGDTPMLECDLANNSWLAFWSGDVGLVIVAEQLQVFSHEGSLAESQINTKYEQWWDYWKQYWLAKQSSSPFPEDYACEVTIPAGDLTDGLN